MDIRTGKIIEFESEEELEKAKERYKEMLIEAYLEEMTEKQKKMKAVSLKDHKSKLGKKLTKARKKAGINKDKTKDIPDTTT